MSGPHHSLRNANRRPNGKISARLVLTPVERQKSVLSSTLERQKTILRSNSKEEQMSEITWIPPEKWMIDVNGFETTDENFGWRKTRAVMALRYLLKEPSELMEQPTQYIPDIW